MQTNKGLKPAWLEECLRRDSHVEVSVKTHTVWRDICMIHLHDTKAAFVFE